MTAPRLRTKRDAPVDHRRRSLLLLKTGAALVVCVLMSAAGPRAQEKHASTSSAAAAGAVATEMRNIRYHFTDDVMVHIRRLKGSLVPTQPDSMPVFDDKNSFTLDIESAEIAIRAADLANLLNHYVFADAKSHLKDIKVMFIKDQIKLTGTLHRAVDIPFETEGRLLLTSKGQIRIHPTKVKAAHLSAKGLMDVFGVELADLINAKTARGVSIEGDDIILAPDRIFPPPSIRGQLTAVRIEGNQIVQVFGNSPSAAAKPVVPGNYMAYRGAKLRFGKLTMSDTDLVLIDTDPRDPFDFNLDHYKEQLVAGYSKTTPTFGLHTYMVDFNKLSKRPRKPGLKPSSRQSAMR